jgi:hypothetical protein
MLNNLNIYKNYAELNYIYFIYCYKTEITERQLNCTCPTYPRFCSNSTLTDLCLHSQMSGCLIYLSLSNCERYQVKLSEMNFTLFKLDIGVFLTLHFHILKWVSVICFYTCFIVGPANNSVDVFIDFSIVFIYIQIIQHQYNTIQSQSSNKPVFNLCNI